MSGPMSPCSECETWRGQYNAAVANGLVITARQIDRRIAAHHAPVERADIPLETYWTDRTAALAEALHEPLRAAVRKSGFLCDADEHASAVYEKRPCYCEKVADAIEASLRPHDALLYLREHGWTLEREER